MQCIFLKVNVTSEGLRSIMARAFFEALFQASLASSPSAAERPQCLMHILHHMRLACDVLSTGRPWDALLQVPRTSARQALKSTEEMWMLC